MPMMVSSMFMDREEMVKMAQWMQKKNRSWRWQLSAVQSAFLKSHTGQFDSWQSSWMSATETDLYCKTQPNFVSLPLWARIKGNTNWSTGSLARPFARPFERSLALLTRLLAPHYSLCLCAPLRSFARSLSSSWEKEWLNGYLFCFFFYSGP